MVIIRILFLLSLVLSICTNLGCGGGGTEEGRPDKIPPLNSFKVDRCFREDCPGSVRFYIDTYPKGYSIQIEEMANAQWDRIIEHSEDNTEYLYYTPDDLYKARDYRAQVCDSNGKCSSWSSCSLEAALPLVLDAIPDQEVLVGRHLEPVASSVSGDYRAPLTFGFKNTNIDVIYCYYHSGLGVIQSDSAMSRGTNVVTLTVEDADGQKAQTSFTVTVPNTSPSIEQITDAELLVGESRQITIQAVDRESLVTLSFEQSNPSAVDCTLAGHVLTLNALAIGVTTITLTATDDWNLSFSTSFQITVPNTSPVIEPIADQQVFAGDTLSIPVSASDLEGPVSLSITSQTNPSVVDCDLVGTVIQGQTNVNLGSSTVTVTASDSDGLTSSTSFTIAVNEPDNYTPQITIPNQSLAIGEALSVDLSQYVADVEDPFENLTISLDSRTNPTAIAVDLDTGFLTGVAIHAGESTVAISVTDTGNKTGSGYFTISIEPESVTYKTHGLDFSPYITGQDPNTGAYVDEVQILERLWIIKPYTNWVRTFGMTHGLEETPRLAKEMGLSVVAGAWLSDDLQENQIQMENLINAAQEGHVDMACVGSEVLLRGDLTSEQLLVYINQFRQAVPGVPVTYADIYSVLMDHSQVVEACNVVFANFYAYWEGLHISLALARLHAQYQEVVLSYPDKEIMVSEAGWPSEGDIIGSAVPSPENAALHFLNFVSWARANNVNFFYFEALDEDWKAAYEGPQGAHWGIWDANGVLKPGMQDVFDGMTLPDNWTCDTIPGDPILDPEIQITSTSGGYASGQVNNIHSSLVRVAVYIRVNGGWWTKPYWNRPTTGVNCDGTWTCDINTGGVDYRADRVAAFLISYSYAPPSMGGGTTLPQALYDNALAYTIVVK